ncbi:uncharacterized protein PHALS_09596 [Plasmopara halstedii]|uniref:Uncharacterized protein n=1 Tax=Plasmopara halstedii TaxID=4781 RepID=A0A0P1AEM3_PLAHL|nr:uncharacterized protein PHALS_09596 [Plasmopara halstedii]CEG39342.1 hypothetical protein PHALS_09596 [Plasmopara halstedii]|eukprot:XP_024575711.1 hypothetical protein PHALS_09596 [Plasmopara halstedii]
MTAITSPCHKLYGTNSQLAVSIEHREPTKDRSNLPEFKNLYACDDCYIKHCIQSYIFI